MQFRTTFRYSHLIYTVSILIAVVSVAFGFSVISHLFPLKSTDFTTGNIILNNFNKRAEIVSMLFGFAVFAIAFLAGSILLRRFENRGKVIYSRSFKIWSAPIHKNQFLAWISIIGFTAYFLFSKTPTNSWISAIALLAIVTHIFIDRIDRRILEDLIIWSVLSTCSLAAIINLGETLLPALSPFSWLETKHLLAVSLSFVALNRFNKKKNREPSTLSLLEKMVLIGLAFNLVVLYGNYVNFQGVISWFQYTNAIGTITLLIMVAMYVYFIVQGKWAGYPMIQALSLVFVVIAIWIKSYHFIPLYEGNDDFHISEHVVPFHQFINYGAIPYIDNIPIKGFHFFSELLNTLLFQGDLGTAVLSDFTFKNVLLAAIFFRLLRVLGFFNVMISAIGCVFIKYVAFLLFPVLCFIILFDEELIRKRKKWLISALFLGWLNLFFYSGIGIAFSLSLMPIVFINLKELINERKLSSLLGSLSFLVVIILILLSSPLIYGILEFTYATSKSHLYANAFYLPVVFSNEMEILRKSIVGLPIPDVIEKSSVGISFIVVKYSMLLIVISLVLKYILSHLLGEKRGRYEFVIALSLFLFCLLTLTYTFGRIDVGITRMIIFPVTGIIFLGPYVIDRLLKTGDGSHLLGLKMIMLISLIVLFDYGPAIDLAKKIRTSETVPQGMVLVGHEFEALKNTFIDSSRYARLKKVRGLLSQMGYEAENDPLYLFNNRGFIYYALNLKNPALLDNHYLSINSQLQMDDVESLRKHMPGLIYIGESMNFDMLNPALRAYNIYKYLLGEGYRPFKFSDQHFMIHPGQVKKLGDLQGVEMGQNLDQSIYSDTLGQPDLKKIPIVLGQGMLGSKHLTEQDHSIQDLKMHHVKYDQVSGIYSVNGHDPYIVFYFRSPLSGLENDFVAFHCTCVEEAKPGSTEFQAQVFWSDEVLSFGQQTQLSFMTRSSEWSLVPVGTNGNWLISDSIETIRFDLNTFDGCRKFILRDPRFFSFNPGQKEI